MKPKKVETASLRYLLSVRSGVIVFVLVGFIGIASVPSGSFGSQAAAQKAKKTSVEPVYSVVSPLGESTVKVITMVPRLNTLSGKTVCMVWNHAFKADVTLPILAESLKSKYPDIKIVPYAEIDTATRSEGRETGAADAENLQAIYKEKGCNAVISGNGG